MSRARGTAAIAWVVLLPSVAAAQTRISSVAPRWGDTVTVTVEANTAGVDSRRIDPADTLFVVLLPWRHGPVTFDRTFARATWDGHHFAGTIAVPNGIEGATVFAATPERTIAGSSVDFVCLRADGTRPPGALISGLTWGGRDPAAAQTEIEADLDALRAAHDDGWAYAAIWLFRLSTSKGAFTADALLQDVRRVDRDVTPRSAGLLSSLVFGYDHGGDTRTAFGRLKEACDRFPDAGATAQALSFGTAAVVNHPEFQAELGQLMADVARRAPANRSLRELLPRLVTNVPAVPVASIRTIATAWMQEVPWKMAPHHLLAQALFNGAGPDGRQEAETLVTKAIDLSFEPHPYDVREQDLRQKAFELRSKLRAAHGDLPGAIADLRMAQMAARDRIGADDLVAEAALWRRLGYARRAEALETDAFRPGSLGQAPAFSTKTLTGAPVEAATLGGRVTVLDFWFIGCPPCRAERPKLNALAREFGDRVRFIGFALDTPEALAVYQAATPLDYEIVPNSTDIAKAFGVDSFPRHMILDPAGRIVWMSGNDDDRIERLRAMIVRVLAAGGK